jgi:hypothetical protein
MSRRYLPILLAAKMQFRLQEFEQAFSMGDTLRAEREADELSSNWTKFGHVAREAYHQLVEKIEASISAIQTGVTGSAPNQDGVTDHVQRLNGLLKQLAS